MEPGESVASLCRRSGVETLYAFGSRGREALAWVQGQSERMGEAASDLDVGVRPVQDKTWGLDDKVQMAIALEDLTGVARVDLVFLPDADPFVAAEIIRGERLYARDEHSADEYDLYILQRAGDLAPLERERMALILGTDR